MPTLEASSAVEQATAIVQSYQYGRELYGPPSPRKFAPAPEKRINAGHCPRHDFTDAQLVESTANYRERADAICLCFVKGKQTFRTIATLKKGKHTCEGTVVGALTCKACLSRPVASIPLYEGARMQPAHSCNYGMRRTYSDGSYYDIEREALACKACADRSKKVRAASSVLPQYVPNVVTLEASEWEQKRSEREQVAAANAPATISQPVAKQPQKDPTAKKVPPKAPPKKTPAPKVTKPIAAPKAPKARPAAKPAVEKPPKAPKAVKAPKVIKPTVTREWAEANMARLVAEHKAARAANHAARKAVNVARRALGLPDYGAGAAGEEQVARRAAKAATK